ncbi:TonB-dependent receptor [Flavobacterium sp. MXW15]|uniref:TonB-dependent receptor n=1 Tax=Xanthomonas chitinilytica TaxID=2989819 RepID=A0ABT3JYB7_9XANT|nr:TonB-dependent receptor [Xanthomonas sp. H13-6]MCW4455368.1 TonB-dependent receptor [Flavobacterium sp. MXW15]MCW4473195.1 TonB-dependent receptor [Xanthomonas sp. H13-6]
MHARLTRKKTPVTLLAFAIGLALQAGSATAQEAPAEATELDTVTVTGYRASVEKALDIKRGEAGVVDAIVAEDVGKFPDLNLAESLQRIPGVVITRDAGEGRNISVRGLGPDFTRVRINGMEALTTVGSSDQTGGTNRSRGFDFNVFASDLFSQMIVRKTASADVEEGSLGATVDLRTARPSDYDGFTFAASGQASYGDMSQKADPRVAALVANTWADGKFGALLSVAYSEKQTLEEGSGSGRWANGPSNGGFDPSSPFTDALAEDVYHPRFPRYTQMFHDQKRTGVTGALQFKPSDRTEFSLDAMYSKIDATRDEHYIEAISFSRSASQGGKPETIVNDGYIDPATGALLYGSFDNVDVRSENRHDEWSTVFKQLSLSGEHQFSDDFRISGKLGTSSSSHENPVQATIMMDKLNVAGYSYDYRGNKWSPVLNYGIDPTDPNGWSLSTIRMRQNEVKNDFDVGQLDFNWNISPGFRLKGGVLAKNYDFKSQEWRRTATETDVPNFADGTPIVPVDLTNLVGLKGVSGSPGSWVVPDFDAIASYFDIYSGEGTFALSPYAASNRSVEEEDRGGWLMGEFSTDLGSIPFSGNFGVRYVKTKQSSTGIATIAGVATPITVDREYSDTLPSLNLVAELTPDFLLRFGAAKVMSRPGLGSLTPGVTVSVSGGSRNVNGGNPNLDPIRARTYDLSAEWYFQDSAMLSLGLFFKDIESFVQTTREVRPFYTSGLPASIAESFGVSANDDFVFSVPVNTPGGDLKGVEANYVQPFTFLPGLWSNFGIQLNYTYVDSQIQYLTSSGASSLKTDLTGLSKHSWNATLFYEGETFAGRVSVTNRDDYLIQVPGTEQGFTSDVHGQTGTTYVDASLRYKVSDQIELSLEGINLTNEPQQSWVGAASQLPLDYSETGRQYLLGFRYKF